MDVFSIMLIIIAGVLAIGIPGIVVYFFYSSLAKKGFRKMALVSVFLIGSCLVYTVYTFIYPNNSFFKDEYKDALNISFPLSGKIIAKDAGYPDQHGHYCSCSLIEINPQDFSNIFNIINHNIAYTKSSTDMVYTDELNDILSQTKYLDTNEMVRFYNVRENIKNKVFIGFLSKKKRIILQRCNF